MAKKTRSVAAKARKSVKKPAKAPVKKAAKAKPAKGLAKPAKGSAKASKAKATVKKSGGGGGGAGFGAATISTGRGMSPMEIGQMFVSMFNNQTPDQTIWDTLFAKQFDSIEGVGVNMVFKGRAAVEAKCREWMEGHTVHGCTCEGPFVGSTAFAVKFRMDVTDKGTGGRSIMEEVAVYDVENGKIVREEFMYGV